LVIRHIPISTEFARKEPREEVFVSGSYRDLKAWQYAIELVTQIYVSTSGFPNSELYGLTSQLRRASVSVASNIAEGKGRASDKELVHFLHQARGSLFEVETQLTIAYRLQYLTSKQADDLTAQAGQLARILNGLITALKESNKKLEEVKARIA
jgi:four helix bundle protein